MLQAAKEFKIGRPQILAGLMLLGFLAQCLWAAGSRKISDLEYDYIAEGFGRRVQPAHGLGSPMTAWVAALPVHTLRLAKSISPAPVSAALSVPHPWLFRLPFTVFGLWLGGALWWVARRLFDDSGGYIALGLYCSSPAIVMISSNIGPEILLAWSIFGLIYTAIGVAHTLYAPARKWAPRIVILGLSIGFAVSTAMWSALIVVLALAFMVYLAPERRRSVFVVLAGAMVIAAVVWAFFSWAVGDMAINPAGVTPKLTILLARNLGFVLADEYMLAAFFILTVTAYGSWARARYFGNTAPLVTAFVVVLLFALVPSLYIWDAVLGLSFMFVFVAGVTADLLETSSRRSVLLFLAAGFALRIVLGIRTLWVHWIGQIQV